jgi:hypothetical protein
VSVTGHPPPAVYFFFLGRLPWPDDASWPFLPFGEPPPFPFAPPPLLPLPFAPLAPLARATFPGVALPDERPPPERAGPT